MKIRTMKWLVMALLAGSMLGQGGYLGGQSNGITFKDLRCEYAANPLGVDVAQPRFSWVLESSRRGQIQSGYQVLVATSEEKLNSNLADKWDSGKVVSDQSVNIPYTGSGLASGEKCYWKVRMWDGQGEASDYSPTASFEMGLLRNTDWEGKWIGAASLAYLPRHNAPLLRKEFQISKKVKRARIYIAGVGWYELYINGRKVGDHVLDPATSDYHKRILYVSYDVTDQLQDGRNALGVMLGNGWYSEPDILRYGDSPRSLLQMNVEFVDGTTTDIATDEAWKVSNGPITRNGIWEGESYDATLEKPGWATAGYDDSGWGHAAIKENPGGRLVSQLMPAIKVNQTLKPAKITSPIPGVFVCDFGQLFGGWTRLHLKGSRDTQVTIKYSEQIYKDSGLVDKRRHRPGNATDVYIMKGDPGGEVYEPRFTYHPVRYVQIEGYPGKLTSQDVEGRVVHSAVDLSGDFRCSNPLLNRIHQNAVWTFTNGLYGMPLDCLYREHWAWTDPATVSGTLFCRKHMPLFWTKWLQDIADSQDENGVVPVTAPAYLGTEPDPAWGGNYPLLVWYLYQYYADPRILVEHYSNMKRWFEYLASGADKHIITKGILGDHLEPGDSPGKEIFISKETPPPLVWTGYYYRDALILSQIAKILGRGDDAQYYSRFAEEIKDAFNLKWLNKGTDQYATGSQTSNLFPLMLGIVPEAHVDGVLRNIVKSIEEQYGGHLHTGNTGTTCMIEALTKYGRGNVMYEVATKDTYPGWGYMVKQGATTIWESWAAQWDSVYDRGGEESMIMWATIEEFFYGALAGIKGPTYYGPSYMTPGFRQIHIAPQVLGDLESASASIQTVRGMVSSSWKREPNSLTLEVSVPVNSQAKVSIPKMGLKGIAVTESGNLIWKSGKFVKGASGITSGNETSGDITFDVGSGTYHFRLASAENQESSH